MDDMMIMNDRSISLNAAIDALGEEPLVWHDDDDYTLGQRSEWIRHKEALEALPSAQPSVSKTEIVGDVISRQAAIAEIMEDLEDRSLHDDPATPEDYAEGYDEGIRNAAAIVLQMPSAQPGWIPISEKLPKDDTEVIVSCTDDSGDYEYSYVTTGWHYKGLWVVNNDRCYFVKAWQPLPAKPWEGGQDDSIRTE